MADENTSYDERKVILDSIADGVFTVDLDFRITYMNRSAEKILGIKEKDTIGKLCYEVFHASICEKACAIRETIASGRNVINKTIYIVNSEGERIPISISTAILKDEAGRVIGGVETFRDISEIEELRKNIESGYTFEDIISKSKRMQEIFSILPDIAESDSTVLIEGKSGTGKELIARAVHNLSRRRDKPIVVINCAALPDNLLESELFGYKAGAFTDAKRDKPGRIAAADGGSIFLDEIGELSQNIQIKLLRFLQEREYEPLGSVKTIRADVRIIAATNRDLLESVQSGDFRQDLYYRLNVVNITLPPLSDRKEDIPILIRHFIKRYNSMKGKHIEGVSDDVINILMEYDYPGNIRELENIIEHAFVLCKGSTIAVEHLPSHLREEKRYFNSIKNLKEFERLYIYRLLEKNNWNRKKTAKELGIDQSTLWRKIKKYDLKKI